MTTKLATIGELRAIEAAAARDGISYPEMMRRAGQAASRILQRQFPSAGKITLLIGKGNNGGDGLLMALDLAKTTRADLRLYIQGKRAADDPLLQALIDMRLAIQFAEDDDGFQQLAALTRSSDILVDALFGIGLRLPLRAETARLLQVVRQNCRRAEAADDSPQPLGGRASAGHEMPARPIIVALDCPSGVDCDSGAADQHCLNADATITFIAAKPGLFAFPAASHVGALFIADIGIPEALPEVQRLRATVLDRSGARALLPPRPIDGHKGSFGKAMLVAGSPNYIGALALAGEAACRSGVGLVTLGATRPLIEIVAGQLREPTWLPLAADAGTIAEAAWQTVADAARGYQALLIGCGLGMQSATRRFLQRLIAAGQLPPLVLDADALNILSGTANWWQRLPAGSILTPHSGEMARLTRLPIAEIEANRWEIARSFASKWQLTLLLKGAHSIIAAPDGRLTVIPFKTEALATAGTGDILAGLIAGLRAQGLPAYESACLAAYVHALAGECAREAVGSSRSVIAGDVLAALGSAFAELEKG